MAQAAPHMSSEEFRRRGKALVDWIADYLESVGSRPVLSSAAPGWVRSQLPARAPEHGESMDAVLADLDRVILPGVTHWQSPNFFAFFPANASYPAILGELLSAGLGVQGMLWATSPACTELETHVLDWLVHLLALPQKFLSTGPGGGVIQDTASSAALCALLAARERATNFASGVQGARQPLTAYTSTQAHSSIEKAVRLCGIGSENLRLIETDDHLAMKPEALEQAMQADLENGKIPCFVCATVGTTSTMAIDPVGAIGPICRRFKAWLHVDAAMAGSAAVCPEFGFVNEHVQQADSYCFNPHKWLLVNFDCNCFWVADRAALIQTMSVLPEYLRNRSSEAGNVIDYRDWQVPLGRRFRSLKLWMTLRHYGAEGLRAYIRGHVEAAQALARWVHADGRFDVAAPPLLNLVCFRHRAGDTFNQRLLDAINGSGRAYLTHTRVHGVLTLRFCVGSARTRIDHVKAAWELIRQLTDELERTEATTVRETA